MTDDCPCAVVETSVHVSAMACARAPASPALEVVHRGVSGHFRFVLSQALLREIAQKLIADFALPSAVVGRYLAQLKLAGDLHADMEPDHTVWCRDASDVFVLMLARTTNAWGIVTYDHDFDDEAQRRSGVTCWKPGTFLALLRERRSEAPGQRYTSGMQIG